MSVLTSGRHPVSVIFRFGGAGTGNSSTQSRLPSGGPVNEKTIRLCGRDTNMRR